MKRTLQFTALALIGLAIFMAGCSKDKKVNPVKTEGNYQDQSYLEAKNYAQDYVDSMNTAVIQGFDLKTFDGSAPLILRSDSASVIFDSASSWWIITAHIQNGDSSIVYNDSIRFEQGDSFMRLPDSLTTTGIDDRVMTNFGITLDSSNFAAEIMNNVHLTGMQAEQLTVNIASSADVNMLIHESAYGQNYTNTMHDIVFNKSDLENEIQPHPISGAMALGLIISAVTPDGSANIGWTITIIFRADGYDGHAESGNNYWDWHVNYNG